MYKEVYEGIVLKWLKLANEFPPEHIVKSIAEEINRQAMPTDFISCPFCGDTGYDIIGLKYHLTYCAVLRDTETIKQVG